VWEDGRIVGGEEWQEKVYSREEWKKLLRTARNRRILHMAMEWNRIVNYLPTHQAWYHGWLSPSQTIFHQ
jgi:hypothetical protein